MAATVDELTPSAARGLVWCFCREMTLISESGPWPALGCVPSWRCTCLGGRGDGGRGDGGRRDGPWGRRCGSAGSCCCFWSAVCSCQRGQVQRSRTWPLEGPRAPLWPACWVQVGTPRAGGVHLVRTTHSPCRSRGLTETPGGIKAKTLQETRLGSHSRKVGARRPWWGSVGLQ